MSYIKYVDTMANNYGQWWPIIVLIFFNGLYEQYTDNKIMDNMDMQSMSKNLLKVVLCVSSLSQ